MVKEYFDFKGKKWGKPKVMPTREQLEGVVGKVEIRMDSDGIITIDKTLTAQERAAIGAL